jgi:hypothetical protein
MKWSSDPMFDAFISSLWLGATLSLFVAAWKWSRWLFPADPAFQRLGHSVVLGWTCVVVIAILLSVGNRLTGPNFLIAGGVVGTTALVLLRLSDSSRSTVRYRMDRPVAWHGLLWCAFFGFALRQLYVNGVCRFPSDWDALTYHLPIVDHWLQAKSLFAMDCRHWTTPGNNEVLTLWATGAFSGDFLATLSSLPSTLLFAASAIGMAAQCGLPRRLSHLTGFALTINTIVVRQLTNLDTDVAVGGCFLAAAFYSLRCCRHGRRADAWFAGLSLGLLAGVKYYALGYALLALTVAVLVMAGRRGTSAAAKLLFIALLGMAMCGGYWYIRNVIATGSALYPKQFFVSNDLLQSINPDTGSTSFFGNGRSELLPLFVSAVWHAAGPFQAAGLVATPLTIPCLLGAAGFHALRRGRTHAAWPRLALVVLVVGTGFLLGITPFAVENKPGTLNQLRWHYCPVRYGTCFLSTATLALAVAIWDATMLVRSWVLGSGWLSSFRCRVGQNAGAVLFCAVGLAQIHLQGQRWHHEYWISWTIGVNLVVLIMIAREIPWPRWSLPLVLAGLIPAVMCGCHTLSMWWHAGFRTHYRLLLHTPSFLPPGTSPPVTVCVFDSRYYPYFGSRRLNRVCQPIYAFSAGWLMDYLRQEEVGFVVQRRPLTGGLKRRYGAIEECVAEYPEAFLLIREDKEFVIHRHIIATRTHAGRGDSLSNSHE